MKRSRTRMLLLGLFLFLTLPVLTYISLRVPSLSWLWPVDTFIRAVPLFLAIRLDGMVFDGGELSPQLLPVWVVLTGLVLWPMLVLGIRPEWWGSLAFRKGVAGYTAVILVCTMVAAQWIFRNTGILF